MLIMGEEKWGGDSKKGREMNKGSQKRKTWGCGYSPKYS